MVVASGDRQIRLSSVSKGTLLHTFKDTNTDFRFLDARLHFPQKEKCSEISEKAYFVLWATSHQINVTKLSLKDDEVLGSDVIELKTGTEYCQGMHLLGTTLRSLICLQNSPNFILSMRLCFDLHPTQRSQCFTGNEERFHCSHTSDTSRFSSGATYQVCFPLIRDSERPGQTGIPTRYNTLHIYRLKRHLSGKPDTNAMDLVTSVQVNDLGHPKDNLVERVKRRLVRRSSGRESRTR